MVLAALFLGWAPPLGVAAGASERGSRHMNMSRPRVAIVNSGPPEQVEATSSGHLLRRRRHTAEEGASWASGSRTGCGGALGSTFATAETFTQTLYPPRARAHEENSAAGVVAPARTAAASTSTAAVPAWVTAMDLGMVAVGMAVFCVVAAVHPEAAAAREVAPNLPNGGFDFDWGNFTVPSSPTDVFRFLLSNPPAAIAASVAAFLVVPKVVDITVRPSLLNHNL